MNCLRSVSKIFVILSVAKNLRSLDSARDDILIPTFGGVIQRYNNEAILRHYGRVLRGGSWNNNPNNMRVANRNRNEPDNTNNNNGFRCVSPRLPHPGRSDVGCSRTFSPYLRERGKPTGSRLGSTQPNDVKQGRRLVGIDRTSSPSLHTVSAQVVRRLYP